MVIVCCHINRYYIQFSFVRMETVYRLLYSLIAVQWKSYNMIAEKNLLHFFMDREEVRKMVQDFTVILISPRNAL